MYNNFIYNIIIAKTLEEIRNYNWKPVWTYKRFAGEYWMAYPLIKEFSKTLNFTTFELATIVEKRNCKIQNLMFYAMLPGGDIPPHRDIVGNVKFFLGA